MSAGKKRPEDPASTRLLRDDAEEQLKRSPERSPRMEGQTPQQLIHELEVHQIELETQAEELRRAHIALEESRDKYLDLYDFAPIGYLSLTETALIEEVNFNETSACSFSGWGTLQNGAAICLYLSPLGISEHVV